MKHRVVLLAIYLSTIVAPVTPGTAASNEIYNILDYGAACDGASDDTTAIQLALDKGAGHSVYVPPMSAECTISKSLRVPSNTLFFGDGCSSRIQAKPDFGDTELIGNKTTMPTTDSQRDTGISIVSLKIDGNKANNSTATEHSPCIFLRAVVDAHVEGIRCNNPKGDGIQIGASRGIPAITPLRNTVFHNFIMGADRNGISITEGEQLNLDKNYISASAFWGIDLEPNDPKSVIRDITINRNLILSSGTSSFHHGIAVSGEKAIIERVNISENIINSATGGGIGFRGVNRLGITRNIINNPSKTGISRIEYGIIEPLDVAIENNLIRSTGSQGIAISSSSTFIIRNNYIPKSGRYGIQLNNSVGSTIEGNVVTQASLDGILLTDTLNTTVTTNTVSSNIANGICLFGKATGTMNTLVTSNVLQGNGAWGVAESGVGTDYNVISGNDVRYNTAGGVQQLGAHTTVSGNVTDNN